MMVVEGGRPTEEGLVGSHPEGDHEYRVPLYHMDVFVGEARRATQGSFKVIRFGVQYDPGGRMPIKTPLYVGLAEAQSHWLKWHRYRTEWSWHLYRGNTKLPRDNYLVHAGSPDPKRLGWGALGCIEVTGEGEWDRLNKLIKALFHRKRAWMPGERPRLSIVLNRATRPVPRPPLRKKEAGSLWTPRKRAVVPWWK